MDSSQTVSSTRLPEAEREGVYAFAEVNTRLWHLPTVQRGGRGGGDGPPEEPDWEAVRQHLEEAPEETGGLASYYMLNWLNPYIQLAWRERLEEAFMPPPRRMHRAVLCGALLSRAFRDEEVRSGRDAWRKRVEVVNPVVTGDGTNASGREEPAQWVVTENPLASVLFRGEETEVRGRLRWIGYVRSSDAPHELMGGVEWDADSPLPQYRRRYREEADEEVVHNGVVHGERLFYQVQRGRARCTCEYVQNLIPETVSGLVEAVETPRAPSLLRALFRTFRGDILTMLPPSAVAMACELSTPWLLQRFVLFLQSNKAQEGVGKGLFFFLLFTAVKLAQPAVMNKQMHRGRRVSSLFRASALALVFEKCLTISPDALSRPEMSTGRVLTMASSDIENIKEFPMQMMFLWMAPILLTLYVLYLFTLVGWSAMAAVVVFSCSLPVQTWLTKVIARNQDSLATCTDLRLRRTNELFSGIRVVKTMGWEPKFVSSIEDEARAGELGYRRRLQQCGAGLWGCIFATPPFMIAGVLTCYTLSGHVLEAAVVLPVIAIISAVTFPVMMLPEAFSSLAKFIVSTDRITRFLECDDSHIIVDHAVRTFGSAPSSSSGGASSGIPNDCGATKEAASALVENATVVASVPKVLPLYEPRLRGIPHVIKKGLNALLRRHEPVELQWKRVSTPVADAPVVVMASPVEERGAGYGTGVVALPAVQASTVPRSEGLGRGTQTEGEDSEDGALYAMEDRELLRDVHVHFPRGSLTVVVGATGSGKSVLLSLLLGTFRFKGRVWVMPSIAYVPQQPWIMQETVEANITFFEGDRRAVRSGESEDSHAVSACSPLRASETAAAAGALGKPLRDRDADGRHFNSRLAEVVRCCQLEADLVSFSQGLQTEIGEKGINLSGGQKARVSLARAVYADREVYLLDDPLSALDAHVGRLVMEEVIVSALAGKTRVLVTHQLQVLPHADQVVVVHDNRIVFTGTYSAYTMSEWKKHVEKEEEAEAAHASAAAAAVTATQGHGLHSEDVPATAYNEFSPVGSPVAAEGPLSMAHLEKDEGADSAEKREAAVTDRPLDGLRSHAVARTEQHGCGTAVLQLGSFDRKGPNPSPAVAADKGSAVTMTTTVATKDEGENGDDEGGRSRAAAAEGLLTEEEKETGHIPWSLYDVYVGAGGGIRVVVFIMALYLVCQCLSTGANVWLTLWAVQYFGATLSAVQYLGVYITLMALAAIVTPVGDYCVFRFTRLAARHLHATLLYTVSSATLTFFDRTPLGRILNRFSKDVYVLDDELPGHIIPLMGIAGYALTSLMVTMYTSPLTVLVVAGAGLIFLRLLKFYTTVVREVRRRGSVVQSPLFSLLEEVVHGRSTVDAYDKSHVLFAEALRRLDVVYSCTYMEKAITLWLAIRIEYVAAVMIVAVGCIGVIEKLMDTAPVMADDRVGLISLSLTMCLDLSWSLSEILNLSAVVEASMNSVQRVCHYIDAVPQEALLLEPRDTGVAQALASHRPSAAVTAAVPQCMHTRESPADSARGALVLEHVDMRYRPGLPLVLRDVCFSIEPGQKVGVVGRTGSGKSTLLLAFLRLVEVCGGRIVVCGRDAREFSLPALRQLFSMIPQDPLLFDGTIRSNVDPFNEATDDEVRAALRSVGFDMRADQREEAGLHGNGDGLPHDERCGLMPALETVVQEGGLNFSVGQRQLLCLARALLKKGSAFILMDEATANVDARLDQMVQRVVRDEFHAYTVVTIAHRLHTVAAYDVVLVMDHGRVVEMGSPRSLLEKRTSVFYGMVSQSPAVTGGHRRQDIDRQLCLLREESEQDKLEADASMEVSAHERRVEAVVAAFLRQCR